MNDYGSSKQVTELSPPPKGTAPGAKPASSDSAPALIARIRELEEQRMRLYTLAKNLEAENKELKRDSDA